jgi:hypothetical protein
MAAGPARAQFGGAAPVLTVPGSFESDQPVEASTADLDTVQLPPIVASVTTTVGAWYQPQGSLLGNLNLFSGVNPQNATQLMPVTQGLPCDSYTPMVTAIAPTIQQTYLSAISATQQLTTELQSEDFSTLATNIQAPAMLAATQANGQVLLQIVTELQLLRAQEAANTLVNATDHLHQLDVEVRAAMPRQGC